MRPSGAQPGNVRVSNDSSTGGFIQPTSAAPAEDAALDLVLQALAAGVTGIPLNLVRPRWQAVPAAEPEPVTDWCAIGVIDETPPPFMALRHVGSDTSGTNPNGYSISVEWTQIRVLASFYGPNARGNAATMRAGLMIGQNRETLFGSGIALAEAPGVARFVPSIINNQTVRRVDIELLFNRAIRRTWPIDDLLSAQFQITTDDGSTQSGATPSSTNPLLP